jgi:hypothetical protein
MQPKRTHRRRSQATVPEFEQTGLFTGYHPLKKMIWFLRISLKLLRSEYRDSD